LLVVVSICSGIGSSKTSWVEVFVILGLQGLVYIYYDWIVARNSSETPTVNPTIHPATFGAVHYYLTSYALVHRGVFAIDALMMEALKSFALSVIYVKVIMYYQLFTSANDKLMNNRAQAIALFMLFFVSMDSLYNPYESHQPFSLFWLLPVAWVAIAVSENVWLDKLRIGYGDYIDSRRDLMLSFMHLVVVVVLSHLFFVTFNFKDIHETMYKYSTALQFRFLNNNEYALPGFIHESLN
jgi:hypothetical protein